MGESCMANHGVRVFRAIQDFEHSVANMYFLPIGVALAAGTSMPLSAVDAFSNLALVTIGNIFGGTVLVALV